MNAFLRKSFTTIAFIGGVGVIIYLSIGLVSSDQIEYFEEHIDLSFQTPPKTQKRKTSTTVNTFPKNNISEKNLNQLQTVEQFTPKVHKDDIDYNGKLVNPPNPTSPLDHGLDAKDHKTRSMARSSATNSSTQPDQTTIQDLFTDYKIEKMATISNGPQQDQNATNDALSTTTTPSSASNAKKPKMVLIVDDVGNANHIKMIKGINLKLTPSFLYNAYMVKNATRSTKGFKSYMIHLPLEAQSYKQNQNYVLNTGASPKAIKQRIQAVKRLFPKANYLNNHTGSKFTGSFLDMKNLLEALDDHDLKFLDSKTTAKSQVKKAAKALNVEILGRDIFLDHRNELKYINQQIQKSVNIAKKHGIAFVIAHPRKLTIQALKQKTDFLNREVELIYIDEL